MRVLFAAVLFALAAFSSPAHARVLVFVPASMTDVMTALAKAHEAAGGDAVVLSMASTSQLARQLDAGAPADVFLTADETWMDWARARKLVRIDTITTFAGNTLVVAVRREVENWADVDAMLTTERFAMAEEEAVPAGRYAKEALISRGLWDLAQKQAVRAENVRTTLRLVARGEVDAAIVYRTDVNVEPDTRVAFTFPQSDHAPIRYYAALTPDAGETAQGFVDFLATPEAQAILEAAGFTLPPFDDPA